MYKVGHPHTDEEYDTLFTYLLNLSDFLQLQTERQDRFFLLDKPIHGRLFTPICLVLTTAFPEKYRV